MGMAAFLAAMGRAAADGIIRPSSAFRRLRENSEAGKGPSVPEIAAGCAPAVLCAFLVPIFPGASHAFAFLFFVLATFPLAGLAFFAAGRLCGSRAAYAATTAAWGHSYWATALFLGSLLASHGIALLLGKEPAALSDAVKAVTLGIDFGALAAKIIYFILAIRSALGLRGWRAIAASAVLLACAAAWTLLSAFIFGSKVPIV